MFVTSINVQRAGSYGYGKHDPTKPFEASVSIDGNHGEVKLKLSPEMSRRVVELIAEEIVAASRATAEAMTADVFNTTALPAPEVA